VVQNVNDKLASSTDRIDSHHKRAKSKTTIGQTDGKFDQPRHRSTEAIKLPHHNHVAGAGVRQSFSQTSPVSLGVST